MEGPDVRGFRPDRRLSKKGLERSHPAPLTQPQQEVLTHSAASRDGVEESAGHLLELFSRPDHPNDTEFLVNDAGSHNEFPQRSCQMRALRMARIEICPARNSTQRRSMRQNMQSLST